MSAERTVVEDVSQENERVQKILHGGHDNLSVKRHGTRVHPGEREMPSKCPGGYSSKKNTKYLPTLFDRLQDHAPSKIAEDPEAYAFNSEQMRAIVQRDLIYLLNTTNLHEQLSTVHFPQIVNSTVNYGVPPLAGGYLSDRKWMDIEKIIRWSIETFEPRLIPDSLMVSPLLKDGANDRYNVLLFEIKGLLFMEPYPMEFMVQSSVDLETNRFNLHKG